MSAFDREQTFVISEIDVTLPPLIGGGKPWINRLLPNWSTPKPIECCQSVSSPWENIDPRLITVSIR